MQITALGCCRRGSRSTRKYLVRPHATDNGQEQTHADCSPVVARTGLRVRRGARLRWRKLPVGVARPIRHTVSTLHPHPHICVSRPRTSMHKNLSSSS